MSTMSSYISLFDSLSKYCALVFVSLHVVNTASAFTTGYHSGILRPAFTAHSSSHQLHNWNIPPTKRRLGFLYAGGFEYEDPEEVAEREAVDNPFKSGASTGGTDAARLLAPRLQGSNLYFVGMMGSGKTAVGSIVAKRMGSYSFLDTDSIIESATGATIPELFEAEGEEGFRKVEAQILDSVHAYVRCVVSTGGGAVCMPQNWSKLQTGIVVWLSVDPELIIKRISGDTNRPLLQTENPLGTLESLLENRLEMYKQADVHVEITEGMSETDVADKVVEAVHNFIDENPPAWKTAKANAQEQGLDWVQ
mmetsp:Transcript_4894/g.9706  ORF Transcript_4894/g.9706 Transcript_4894/m.9706 type:complete len:308 (-) Transcript_4894:857-1780(-)